MAGKQLLDSRWRYIGACVWSAATESFRVRNTAKGQRTRAGRARRRPLGQRIELICPERNRLLSTAVRAGGRTESQCRFRWECERQVAARASSTCFSLATRFSCELLSKTRCGAGIPPYPRRTGRAACPAPMLYPLASISTGLSSVIRCCVCQDRVVGRATNSFRRHDLPPAASPDSWQTAAPSK